jgi:MFS family permease
MSTPPKFRKDAEGPFVWDEGIQQLVISSFFWGYAITQVPGGRLSERFGVKKVMVVAMLSTALCSMFIPLAASMHFSVVILLRVIMGLLEVSNYLVLFLLTYLFLIIFNPLYSTSMKLHSTFLGL